jgi:DNA-binding IclR family transcriptional regulator
MKAQGPTAKIITLLKRRPHTVAELVKATKCSTAHVRSVLYSLSDKGLKTERSLTRYRLAK